MQAGGSLINGNCSEVFEKKFGSKLQQRLKMLVDVELIVTVSQKQIWVSESGSGG